jgi:hypothetical protein
LGSEQKLTHVQASAFGRVQLSALLKIMLNQ